MELTVGMRLRSQVCATEVVVVRPGGTAGELTCGGSPLVAIDSAPAEGRQPESGLDGGTQIGKRYTDGGDLELLVTKSGAGTLGIGHTPLELKGARPLPSSD
jgi:hypothetical protein